MVTAIIRFHLASINESKGAMISLLGIGDFAEGLIV